MQSTISEPDYRGGIYVIWLSDLHFYGGRASIFQRRWNVHLRHLRRGSHSNLRMQAVFNLYGRFEPRVHSVITNPEERVRAEQEWLNENLIKAGCVNLSRSASGAPEERKTACPLETRAKISAALRGRKHPPERIAKTAGRLRGRTLSVETRSKISAANKGKTRTPETCLNMKWSVQDRKKREFVPSFRKGKELSQETKDRMILGQERRRLREGSHPNRGRSWMHHPELGRSRLVQESEMPSLAAEGWFPGRKA